MEEWFLNDLLECSVCLESMDNSSKVLPCQHTFCKKCLGDIVKSHKELRCPECRVLVGGTVEELPPNILLMRILEGMKSKKGKPVESKSDENVRVAETATEKNSETHVPGTELVTRIRKLSSNPFSSLDTNFQENNSEVSKSTNSTHYAKPCAVALNDYDGGKYGDLVFKKGDLIYLKKKIDLNWYHGEINGQQGYFPSSYLQIIVPLPSLIPQCKTLYDFQMNNDDEKDCLTFQRGQIINVLRRVDEHWAEGKLGEKIGIFPLTFVEMNSVAKALMKSSLVKENTPRMIPPAPLKESSEVVTSLKNDSTISSQSQQLSAITTSFSGTTSTSVANFDYNSSESSTSTPDSTPTPSDSSSSSTTLSSPSPPSVSQESHSKAVNSNVKACHRSLQKQAYKEKRHSFTASVNSKINKSTSLRHSMDITDLPSDCLVGSINTNGKEKNNIVREKSGSNSAGEARKALSSSVNVGGGKSLENKSPVPVPTIYQAMFSYKPQKSDELELNKGDLYIVSEKCQDGWFKGTSLKSGKSGVFPGNYVQLAKSSVLPVSQLMPSVAQIRSCNQHGTKSEGGKSTPVSKPLLPPRCLSPAQKIGSNSISWHGNVPSSEIPPGCFGSSSFGATKRDKEKPAISLMKLLTGKVKSKSPPPHVYSMDNPVFEDPVISSSVVTPVHVRSGSCPSQILETNLCEQKKEPDSAYPHSSSNVKIRSRSAAPKFGSHRAKAKPRPNIVVTNKIAIHQGHESKEEPSSDSLLRKVKQIAPLYRERFRCIVPYPPQSEIELELNVGDIVFVHKKREDGWYKGTLQRTGRTGLFPGSFVENA